MAKMTFKEKLDSDFEKWYERWAWSNGISREMNYEIYSRAWLDGVEFIQDTWETSLKDTRR